MVELDVEIYFCLVVVNAIETLTTAVSSLTPPLTGIHSHILSLSLTEFDSSCSPPCSSVHGCMLLREQLHVTRRYKVYCQVLQAPPCVTPGYCQPHTTSINL